MPARRPALETTPAGRLDAVRLSEVLGYRLAQASIVTTEVFATHAGTPYDLRPVEYTLLTLIAENPGGSPARLARALAVTAPNITMWIDKLERRGLVRRLQSTTDRRAQVLEVTPAGAALSRDATEHILSGERAALAPLSLAERAMLIELLDKVARARKG